MRTHAPTSTRPVIILTLLSSPQPAHHLSRLLCTLRTLDALRVQWQLTGTAHVRGRHCAEGHGQFCDASLVNFRRDGVSSCGANTVRAALPGHVSKSFRTGPKSRDTTFEIILFPSRQKLASPEGFSQDHPSFCSSRFFALSRTCFLMPTGGEKQPGLKGQFSPDDLDRLLRPKVL